MSRARRVLRAHLERGGLPGSKEAADPLLAVAALDAFEAWSGRAGRGRVVDSFWSAWDAFASANDYPAAVIAAVRYGNDTDTTAAIAGGLAGVHFGIAGIPLEWHRGLRDRALAQRLIDRLVETDDSEWDGRRWSTSSTNPLRVDLLDLAGSDIAAGGGRAGMTFLPGKRYVGYYNGPQWRDLDSDLASLIDQGVDTLLLLVEDKELRRCRVTHIEDAAVAHGLELLRHPVPDPQIPAIGRGLSPGRGRGGRACAVGRHRRDRLSRRARSCGHDRCLPAARGGPGRGHGHRSRPRCASPHPDHARPAALRAGLAARLKASPHARSFRAALPHLHETSTSGPSGLRMRLSSSALSNP